MRVIRAFFAYVIAAGCIVIVLATFIGMNAWSQGLVAATGLKVSPWFTGGEVAFTVQHEGYRMEVHRAVFDGLLAERRKGFVQINWVKGSRLPEKIEEEIDYDRDGTMDFTVSYDSRSDTAELASPGSNVLGVDNTYQLDNGYAIRVKLKNPAR